MSISSGLGTFGLYSSTAGAFASGIGGLLEARNKRKVAEYNAQMADQAATDALARGETAADQERQQYAQVKGSATASMAARGVALDEGSPAAVLQSIDLARDQDTSTILQNAMREATNYRAQAWNDQAEASGAYGSAIGSLLTGASTVGSKWSSYLSAKGY